MTRLERLSHLSIILVGAVALFAALHALATIFAPLALALVMGVVLSPLTEFWNRHHVPHALGAVITLGLTLFVLAALAMIFQPAADHLLQQAPKVWSDVKDGVNALRSLVEGLSDLSRGITEAVAPKAAEAAGTAKQAQDMPVKLPDLTSALMLAPEILTEFMVFVGSLFFFLLTRSEIYNWAAKHLSEPATRGKTAQKMQAAEQRVARYFLTITMINAGLGIVTAVSFQFIGLPSAISWGILAFLVNFIPYLGPGLGTLGMLYAGLAAYDGAMSGAPAAIYLVFIVLESQFVTPTLIGRNVAVNSLLVFLALIFGFWLWGPIGGVVAIPLLLWVLVLSDMLPHHATTPAPADAAE